MRRDPTRVLDRLWAVRDSYSPQAAAEKLELLAALRRRRLAAARDVVRLHETLCFLHAYPDNADVLHAVEEHLRTFGERTDLKRFAPRLADTGIAGTEIHYPFYWTTALRLAERWPGRLRIDWPAYSDPGPLDHLLFQLLPFTESLALDEADLDTRGWIDLLKGPGETDAEFVLRRIARLRVAEDVREKLFDDLEIPFALAPGPDTPTRTGPRYAGSPVVPQRRALERARPDLRAECRRPPLAVVPVSAREGERLIDLAREAMVTRARDLYSFKFADPRDVRMIECGEGLQFAAMGLLPERRLMLDSVYGYLTLKNGVPIGYVLTSAFYRSAEVAYNVFDTFRGGESAGIYGRVLAMVRHLFRADVFTIDPYQLGHDNDEGLASGAWWFYYKLGFRPRDRETIRLVKEELRRMHANPGHRSSKTTLNRLSATNMFLYLGREREDVRGLVPVDRIGLAVSRRLGEGFGSDREGALRTCAREAAALTGVRGFRGWSHGERLAFERWAPLIVFLPGVHRWAAEERRALGEVARAKGGRRESDFVLAFDAHRRLRRALLALAAEEAAR